MLLTLLALGIFVARVAHSRSLSIPSWVRIHVIKRKAANLSKEKWQNLCREPVDARARFGARELCRVPDQASLVTDKIDGFHLEDHTGLSSRQYTLIALFESCASQPSMIGNESHQDGLRKVFLLPFGKPTLEAALHSERQQRGRWVQRAGRFVWYNYELHNFGAPEIDPRDGQHAQGEWTSLPMFVYDNLDSVHALKLWDSEQRIYRWLEISTLLYEAAQWKANFLRFREDYFKHLRSKSRANAPFPDPPDTVLRYCDWDTIVPHSKGMVRSGFVSTEKLQELAYAVDLCMPEWIASKERSLRGPPMTTYEHLLWIQRGQADWPTFDRYDEVSFFEMTIRALGGLLSGFILSGQPIAMYLAWDVGHRLSKNLFSCCSGNTNPAECHKALEKGAKLDFHSVCPVCLPSRDVELSGWRTFDTSREVLTYASAAVIGSNQLEFQALSDFLGDCHYAWQSDRLLRHSLIATNATNTGLFPIHLRHNGRAGISASRIYGLGAEIDSFYEYLIKSLKQFNGKPDPIRLKAAHTFADVYPVFLGRIKDIDSYAEVGNYKKQLPHPQHQEHWIDNGLVDIDPFIVARIFSLDDFNDITRPTTYLDFTHLSCFAPGMSRLLADLPDLTPVSKSRLRAVSESMSQTCASLYVMSKLGVAPEAVDLSQYRLHPIVPVSLMRPEVTEGLLYQWNATRKLKYQNFIWQIFDASLANNRVRYGFCSIESSQEEAPTYASCRQDTWILAETIKYHLMAFTDDHWMFKPNVAVGTLREASRFAAKQVLKEARYNHSKVCDNIASINELINKWIYPFGINSVPQAPPPKMKLSGRRRAPFRPRLGEHQMLNESDQDGFAFVFTTEAHPVPLLDANTLC